MKLLNLIFVFLRPTIQLTIQYMNEFIFSINSIFKGHEDIGKSPKYYIGPYQRGYKWNSSSRYDQVPQLIFDTYEAFLEKAESYYLQYITVKYDRYNNWMEVIDGQQRLTTLSLLFYLIGIHQLENIAEAKVIYSRYKNGNVFNKVVDYIQDSTTENDEDLLEQDFYYLAKAARCIKHFLDLLQNKNKLKDYIDYMRDHVMIILNKENEFSSPEETFLNLNDNKVPLTNNYLIKGLLLTLAVRRHSVNNLTYSYEEILNQRNIMGREWDEIYSWISIPNISNFFFPNDDDGMEKLLEYALDTTREFTVPTPKDNILEEFAKILQELPHKSLQENNLQLFNKYNERIKNADAAFLILKRIKHIYLKLRGIFNNPKLYNLLGYVMFCKKTTQKLQNFNISDILDKSDMLISKDLKQLTLQAIPVLDDANNNKDNTGRYPNLRYSSKNDGLTNLLLSFSVFPEVSDTNYRFDFCAYAQEEWSFEHISPQHPKSDVAIDKTAKENVIRKIKEQINLDDEKKEELIKHVNNDEKIKSSDIDFLYGNDIDLHSLGNMALLTGGANSALSNNPYIAKRGILFAKHNGGYFIPRHTMDVFNKVLNTPTDKPFTPDLLMWNNDDIKAHIAWMEKRNISIRENLRI